MKFKLCALAFAASALVAGTAQAALTNSTEAFGNSSVIFVAIDVNNNTGLVLDLGLSMSDFANSTTFTSGLTSPVTWNFGSNTTSLSTTDNQWSAAYNTFKSTQAGGDLQWAVIAGDSTNVASVTATNVIAGRGLLATGNPTVTQMTNASTSGPTGTGLGNFSNFVAVARNGGTLTTAENGARAVDSASGNAWLPNLIAGTFGGGALTWSYLVDNGVTSSFQFQQQIVANPVVRQFGNPVGVDAFSAAPITFSFDIATDSLVLAPAIPEPGTYAMLLAGLAAVGFVARRRKAA